ncbi:unnamed protein product [Rotaria socialis]|uniref:Uncharacterized protein n=1 Tax=Rotaria socialis TaxID=392032 RepID=A0A821U7A8_9BILA|nr:unnamed protein product [Rotaria socialis]
MTTKNTNSYNQEEEQQQHETLQYFDKMPSDLPWNIKEKSEGKEKLDKMEEQILLGKMSQLSTSATHEKHSIRIMKEIRDQLEIIPNYLTKQNISFKELMHRVLSSIIAAEKSNNNDNNMNELRKIAILLYKIMVIQTYQYLWKTYFKSGKINENEICLKFVNEQLNELQRHLKSYEQELNIHANDYQGYTLSIQEIIKTYIEQNLNSSLHKKIEHQVELIYYDYHIRALKLEYFQLQPNQYKKQLMKQICQKALMKQFKEVAIQSRNALFNMYVKSAEDQREEYKNKHEANVKKINESQYTLNKNEKLSSTLVQLIHERFNKISERIRYNSKQFLFDVQITLSIVNINNIDGQNNIVISNQEPSKRKKCHESTNLKSDLTTSGQNYQSQPILKTAACLNKRKRDISSQQLSSTIANQKIPKTTSSISIAQSSTKKMKNISETMDIEPIINRHNNDMNEHTNYRQPMYLTRSSFVLCEILNKALNYSLKKKDEKEFIHVRLQLYDQQYCLEIDQQLWQSYLDIGLQQHLWPDQFYTMAKTNDFELCKQYVMNYIENNKKQLNHWQFELAKQEQQFQACLIQGLSFEYIEYRLKELVHRERKYLSKRNNDKLIKFKDDISEKQQLTTISTTSLMNNPQVNLYNFKLNLFCFSY